MHVLVQPAGVLECLEPKDPHVILHYTPAERVELQERLYRPVLLFRLRFK